MAKLTPQVKEFIDIQLKTNPTLNYGRLIQTISRRYGLRISKATLSKRARCLHRSFRRGRKRILPPGKRPAQSIFLDCAGAFFLKGAELEMQLLEGINRLLMPTTESARAQAVLQLARQINALLLYAPVFGLQSVQDISEYAGRGLFYLTPQTNLPSGEELHQYLCFLQENSLLPLVIKEVVRTYTEALFLRIDVGQHTFYLDAQTRTVWSKPKIPSYFSVSLNKAKSYIERFFLFPAAHHPLILQTCPGYTFLPPEMCQLLRSFEQAREHPFSRIVIVDRGGREVSSWRNVQPKGRCYFLAPLSPWQYARLQGTRIHRPYQNFLLGPQREPVAVADADVNLFDTQVNENIKLRAALLRQKEERLALITNITRREERYIRKIAEQYFTRWPDQKVKTYFDLLEEAHARAATRPPGFSTITPLLTKGYAQNPLQGFKLLLTHLHHYARTHFFPPEYAGTELSPLLEGFYQQSGYLKIKQNCWEIFLHPFPHPSLHQMARRACQRFNQSEITFPDQKRLYIFLL